MSEISFDAVEVGVDWLTGTVPASQRVESFLPKFAKWMLDEQARGNERKAWGFSGYRGFACGSVQVGQREDGYCFRLGSHCAAQHWRELFSVTKKATRIDLQYTLRFNCDPSKIVHRSYRQVKRLKRKCPHGPSHSLFAASDQSSTLYLGSRTSEIMGRVYDKSRESKDPFYRNCARFETECKGDTANNLAHALYNAVDPEGAIAARVRDFMRERGVTPWLEIGHRVDSSTRIPASDRERSLAWLRDDVQPTVRRLLQNGAAGDVYKALGLPYDSEPRPILRGPTPDRYLN